MSRDRADARAPPEHPHLVVQRRDDRWWLATRPCSDGSPVYGEWVGPVAGGPARYWDPTRSKLAAALVLGWEGVLPGVNSRWLYLGAASGTTVSHVADLVGPQGSVVAVERSLRPFSRLVQLAERYPNILPVLADARRPNEYAGTVGAVDGIYADVAQPEQVDLVRRNAELFLRPEGDVLLALKAASLGRDRPTADHVRTATAEFSSAFGPAMTLPLAPLHRQHFLLGSPPTERTRAPTPARGERFSRRPGPRAARAR